MSWAAEEFATVELGDKRLNKRLVKLAQQLAAKPTASIPGACGGWGDTAAAYRMLDNERCDWREIIETHGRCAVQRIAGLRSRMLWPPVCRSPAGWARQPTTPSWSSTSSKTTCSTAR